MDGQFCPECGTPCAQGGMPGCPCAALATQAAHAEWAAAAQAAQEAQAALAARAAHDAQAARTAEMAEMRTAEMAAAEDFDPLRIRPYVTLDANDPPTTELRMAGPMPAHVPVLPAPPGAMPDAAHASRHRAPRRAGKALAFGVTAAAVLGTAAFASGLFPGGGHSDEALGDTLHAGMADEGSLPDSAVAPSPAAPRGLSALSPASPSPSVSASTKAGTPPPATTAATVHHSGTEQVHATSSLTLRFGDSGPGVVELQHRLAALSLYHGSADGQFDEGVLASVRIYQVYRHVTGDAPGVYGPSTRRALESEKAPQQHTGTSAQHPYAQHPYAPPAAPPQHHGAHTAPNVPSGGTHFHGFPSGGFGRHHAR